LAFPKHSGGGRRIGEGKERRARRFVAPSSTCNTIRDYGFFFVAGAFVAALVESAFFVESAFIAVESILWVLSIFMPVSVAGVVVGAGAIAGVVVSLFAFSFDEQAASTSTAATRAKRFIEIS
jgi:hypothetical protein